MNRFSRFCLAAGACLTILAAGTAEASDTIYWQGNTNYPMIQSSQNDEKTDGRLFLDLSSVKITDVFSDGLEASARLLQVQPKGKVKRMTVKVRFDVEGREWVQGAKDTWYGIPEYSTDPAALVVDHVRQEMGSEARRDTLLAQIEKITVSKKGKLESADPKGAVLLTAAGDAQAAAEKKKAQEARKKAEEKAKAEQERQKQEDEQVQVTIIERPEVEITSSAAK